LRFVDPFQTFDRLDLDDDFLFHEQIDTVPEIEDGAAIRERQPALPFELELPFREPNARQAS
jgi:hypothetical protein